MAENIETPEITGQSQGAQTSAGGNAASKISSMLKGLQNFNVADFVKGKPGQWQKMAVVAVVVVIVMGLGAVMMWGLALWALGNSFGEPSGSFGNGACPQAFDRSKLTIYESTASEANQMSVENIKGAAGRQFAKEKLNISESSMLNPGKPAVEDMIRKETVQRFSESTARVKSKVEQAQRAILTYQEHEGQAGRPFDPFDSNGNPSYTSGTIDILSLTKDKFTSGSKWNRVAASYDTQYAIYLGLQEIFGHAEENAASSLSGEDLWKYAIGKTYWPADPDCLWESNDHYCRFKATLAAWNHYASEVAYVCNTSVSGTVNGIFGIVDKTKLSSWYYNQGSAKRTGGGYWGPKSAQCSGWSRNYAGSGCGITSLAMIARYYGQNIDPYQMGTEVCRKGTILLGPDQVRFAAKRVFGMRSHLVARSGGLSVQEIKSALSHGPLLAQGKPAFGSSGGHFVVIAGIEGDNFIINDPSSSSRGKAGRKIPFDQRGNIYRVYYFTK